MVVSQPLAQNTKTRLVWAMKSQRPNKPRSKKSTLMMEVFFVVQFFSPSSSLLNLTAFRFMTWRTEIYRFLFKLLDTLMVLQNWYFWPSNKSIGSYTTPSSVIARKTATWRRFNHGEIPKERGNSSKHRNSTKKIFQTSSLIEYYRQSVIIHINSTENIRSYTC